VLTHLLPGEASNAENLHRARTRFDGAVELAEPGATYAIAAA
jgi:hypothetical protein